jgi:hypothetical protein
VISFDPDTLCLDATLRNETFRLIKSYRYHLARAKPDLPATIRTVIIKSLTVGRTLLKLPAKPMLPTRP